MTSGGGGAMRILLVTSLLSSALGITVSGPPQLHGAVMRRQLQPVRAVRLHRSGGQPQGVPVIRVRPGPVKRIYVPVKVAAPPRYGQAPGAPYRLTPQLHPQSWKPQPVQHNIQQYRPLPQPHNVIPSGSKPYPGPGRKPRPLKPRYPSKTSYPPKYRPVPSGLQTKRPQSSTTVIDSYHPSFNNQPSIYETYGTQQSYPKPSSGTIKEVVTTSQTTKTTKKTEQEPAATSYAHLYQGDGTDAGQPIYGYSHVHQNYEKKHKGSVYDSDLLNSNHRPVYKHKSDSDSEEAAESSKVEVVQQAGQQGGFQPPKQTFGFTPYDEEAKSEGTVATGVQQGPGQQYYKKQPDTVLGPNYFQQNKS